MKEACQAVRERRRGEHLKPMADESFDENNENNTASDNNGNAMDRDDLLSLHRRQ